MTDDKQKQVEQEVAAALAANPRPKCDDAYRAADHVSLEEWRQVWNRQSDALVKAPVVSE